MLAANGMPPTAEESVVASDPEAEFVAVTAINREALRQVEEKLGDRARFTTPLLHTPREYGQNRVDEPPGGTSIY